MYICQVNSSSSDGDSTTQRVPAGKAGETHAPPPMILQDVPPDAPIVLNPDHS